MERKNNSRWLTPLIAESEKRPPCKLTRVATNQNSHLGNSRRLKSAHSPKYFNQFAKCFSWYFMLGTALNLNQKWNIIKYSYIRMDLSFRGERKAETPVSRLSQKANAFSIDSLLGQKVPKQVEDNTFNGLQSTLSLSGPTNPKHADLPPGKHLLTEILNVSYFFYLTGYFVEWNSVIRFYLIFYHFTLIQI